MVSIGRYVDEEETALRVQCDDPELSRHIDRPWFRAYAEERLGRELTAAAAQAPSGEASVSGSELARHACVCGSSGSGKTRLALHLLAEQLKAGCSVVMLDPKAQTIEHLLGLAHAAGVPAENVTVLRPDALATGAPGWNPLAGTSGIPAEQAAADVVSVLAQSAKASWGYRLQDLLTNALIVLAAHRLSLFELARFLQRDDYRDGLLQLPPNTEALADPESYAEALHYFVHEFARWSPGERMSATGPVGNKFRELLRSPFLRAVLCARRTTFDLSDLWRRQSVIAIHLDTAGLGDEGARLLGGLVAHQLYQTALRASGPVPVVLCLDEMGVAEGFIGDAAEKILAMARSQNLRILVACQHLAQLSDGLRSALLANTAVRAFFRLGYDDARLVSGWLAAGTGERTDGVRADAPSRPRSGEERERASVAHTVCDGFDTRLELSESAWMAFSGFSQTKPGDAQLIALRQLADLSGIGRLYVRAADTGQPVEVNRYVRGLAAGDFAFTGPAPVQLVVSFPRPRLSVTARQTEAQRGQWWLRTLMELPVRHTVLRSATGTPGVVKVAAVPDPLPAPGLARFLSEAARRGQSAAEVKAALEWRKAEVERIAFPAEQDDPGVLRSDRTSSPGCMPAQRPEKERDAPASKQKVAGKAPHARLSGMPPKLPAKPNDTVPQITPIRPKKADPAIPFLNVFDDGTIGEDGSLG